MQSFIESFLATRKKPYSVFVLHFRISRMVFTDDVRTYTIPNHKWERRTPQTLTFNLLSGKAIRDWLFKACLHGCSKTVIKSIESLMYRGKKVYAFIKQWNCLTWKGPLGPVHMKPGWFTRGDIPPNKLFLYFSEIAFIWEAGRPVYQDPVAFPGPYIWTYARYISSKMHA